MVKKQQNIHCFFPVRGLIRSLLTAWNPSSPIFQTLLPQKDPVCFYCMDRCMVFYPETCSPVLPRNSVPLLPGNIPLRYRAVNPSCFFPFQTGGRLRLSADSLRNFSRTIRYYLLQDTYPSDFFHMHRQVHKNDSDITLNNRNLSY